MASCMIGLLPDGFLIDFLCILYIGGKKFTQIHTKHLTVTIDAFTIHNSLWLGKKVIN